jgi:F0F1-type ATP synthase assembly protein I
MTITKIWEYIKKNHVVIFLSLLCLFLLLWNLDRYVNICPYGVIPAVIGLIMEIFIFIDNKKNKKAKK